MATKGKFKVLSFILTFALIFSNLMGISTLKIANAETYLINEEFNSYVSTSYTVPAGWTFNLKTNGNYTSSGNYGTASPSVKFGTNGDNIITPTFSNPAQLSFWIKGNSGTNSMAGSSFLIEQWVNNNWVTVDNITSISTTAMIKTYNLDINATQLKFTYTKLNGNVAFDDVKVTAAQSNPIAVESVSLNKTDLSLPVNASEKLIATISPSNATNQNVSWTSSDNNIAKVSSDGTVTGISEGSAVITVTTEDGGKTASCNVTVTPQIHVTNVTLDQHELTLNVGQKATLTPSIEPSDATVKTVTWTSSDDTIAKVTNGSIQALKEGNATITVTTDDGNFTDTCSVTVLPIPKLSIADARNKSIGDYVTVEGIVTLIDKPTSGSNWNYYVQDDTAGIDLYAPSQICTVGDKVTVTGVIKQYNGLLEIVPSSSSDVSIESSNNPLPQPKVITIADAKGETYESQLVRIENVTLGATSSNNTPITDQSGNSINIYKMPSLNGINPGDTVNVTGVVSQYSGGYELLVGDASNIVKVEQKDTTPPVIDHTPVVLGNTGEDLEIKAVITDNKAVAYAKVHYRTKGDASYKEMPMAQTANPNEYSAVIPKTELSTAGLQYYIEAGDGTNISTLPEDISNPYEVSISIEDITSPEVTDLTPSSGASTGDVLRPVISAKYSDASGIDISSVKLTLDGSDVTSYASVSDTGLSFTPSTDLSQGEHYVTLEVCDKSPNKNKALVTWNFYVGEYNLYFGQLHSHTNYSDGIGTPDEAYAYARDNAKLDFLAVTDHSNSFDNGSSCSMADSSKSTKWLSGHQIADQYTENGKFVGIYAYEMTWSNGTGHINTFNTPGFETRDNQVYKNADGLQQYYKVLKQFPDSISQFNHPGTTFGDFNDFAYYDPEIDKDITLIEVGNGEGKIGSSGYFPSYDYYTRALDKGWHLSPTNNQDNHLGHWGDANTARTVVLAGSLTRDSIYDAMKHMRTYATEDNDLRIYYTLNGNVMGTILNQKPNDVDIKVDLEDPDNEALGKVSVIANGGTVVASKNLATNKDTVEFDLKPDYSYYYIRVDEADGDIAVTAPVWIGDVDKAGISKTTGSTALPIKGQAFTITTSLYNNESVPMNIESLVYSIDGNVINEAGALSPVESYSTSSYSFDYTPDKAGKQNIDVVLKANINGVEKVFTDVYAIDVADPAVVTNIMVDASHYNDYVSGYYSGNMTNLITLANGEKINVILQKDKITDDALKDVQLLILSPPAKKSGTANGVSYNASPYTDDEIAAIKRYADNGGNIIVTALADYQDSRNDSTNHSAYQQNRILEAIGAETRINDDEVVDYDNNPNVNPPGVAGGTPYRVPMNVYNMDSPYLKGVAAEQNYSFYSGCSLTLGKDAVWLVKGYPTTYGFNSDNDSLGGSYVSAANKTIPPDTGIGKGNVVALATETLPGGGRLFVGGTVFYSNFEIKVQLDNASQLQNSNYNITMNILDSIKKEIPVTPINVVRSGELGNVYCVEGIVTAGTTPSDNAFFDTLYIQDTTGGINLYPVSGVDIKVGQNVKAVGTLDEYLGDMELRVSDISVTDESINPIEPVLMSTKDAMDSKNGGMLVRVEGNVTRMDSQNIYVDDESGEARAYVDGYIGDGSGDPSKTGKWDPSINIGDRVSIVGLASVDPNGPRLRVRNTSEIVKLATLSEVAISTESTTLERTKTGNISISGKMSDGTLADLSKAQIQYMSSDTDIVTVDANGLITANKVGTAQIWASVTMHGKTVQSNRLEITVKAHAVSQSDKSSINNISLTERMAGTDRYETCVKISEAGWQYSDYAVLTTGEDFPDALSAAPLAGKYNAPILITNPKTLTAAIESEIKRLKVKKIFIIGGFGAVSKEIEDKLASLSITCTRIKGNDRYETAANIAEFLGVSENVIIATGEDYPDALSIASYAAFKKIPILLTQKDRLPDSTALYIKNKNITKTYVIGGTGVVSDDVLKYLPNPERLFGNNRYATNAVILNRFSNEFNAEKVFFATGENFPDALAGSALAAKLSSPIMLVNDNPSSDLIQYIKNNASKINIKYVLGGQSTLPYDFIDKLFK